MLCISIYSLNISSFFVVLQVGTETDLRSLVCHETTQMNVLIHITELRLCAIMQVSNEISINTLISVGIHLLHTVC